MVLLLIFLLIIITVLFQSKTKLAGRTGNGGTKDVKIMVPLNCTNQTSTFTLTNPKLYVPVVTLSNQVLKEQLTGININQKY